MKLHPVSLFLCCFAKSICALDTSRTHMLLHIICQMKWNEKKNVVELIRWFFFFFIKPPNSPSFKVHLSASILEMFPFAVCFTDVQKGMWKILKFCSAKKISNYIIQMWAFYISGRHMCIRIMCVRNIYVKSCINILIKWLNCIKMCLG